MKIYYNIDEFKATNKSVTTTGTFDGVHLGHNVILNKLKQAAQNFGGETVLLTFFPHPRMVLQPENTDLRLLNTIDERIELLKKSGIDHLIIHPFSKEFSRLSSIEFVRDILVSKLNTHKLVIGYDHHFGRNREGSFIHLKEFGPLYGFEVEEIPAQDIEQINISSTKVRNSLNNGNIKAANQFLGYHYFIKGTVVEGEKIGREIGFPTANIKVKEWYKLIPANGVYAVNIILNKIKYNGMLNIGNRPTLNGNDITIEVNIFNFNANIYNNEIRIEFIDRIRDEQKFDKLDELKQQLEIDKKTSVQLLS
ncbi:bifunctional riboflavin kinase/FAD synthetase [Vicingus serpentipes]|uniref:Riboflavin biosynthesis protein n=1 Tax=Vicingus serpentipes TaxID=1926625 RepID=A0A5C6RTW2_9FLAO|nr:bifunctional riboflavin kinase/FAD synthetase [Vicingus serpentipes]TXB65110.1 bifunctional riboflavin kinase/FAD synthetase [Vicingus serpentipes]